MTQRCRTDLAASSLRIDAAWPSRSTGGMRSFAMLLATLLVLSLGAACRHEAQTPGGAAPAASGSASGASQVSPAGDGACGNIQCFRAIRCVESCNGAPVQIGCCLCPAGSFDDVTCPKQ